MRMLNALWIYYSVPLALTSVTLLALWVKTRSPRFVRYATRLYWLWAGTLLLKAAELTMRGWYLLVVMYLVLLYLFLRRLIPLMHRLHDHAVMDEMTRRP